MPHASEATKGQPSEPLAKRVAHLVSERASESEPAVAESEVAKIARHMYARDGETTSPRDAIQLARQHGKIIRVRHPQTREPYLCPSTATAAAWALGENATVDDARKAAAREAQTTARQPVIAAYNAATELIADE